MELTNVFTQLKIKLDQEISEKRSVEVLQQYYMDSLPLLQANFYSTLIEGRIREEELEEYLTDYQITFTGPYYCCLVIHTSATQVPKDMNPLLLATSVQKQAEERLQEKWRAKSFTYLGNAVMLAQLKGENEVPELTVNATGSADMPAGSSELWSQSESGRSAIIYWSLPSPTAARGRLCPTEESMERQGRSISRRSHPGRWERPDL